MHRGLYSVIRRHSATCVKELLAGRQEAKRRSNRHALQSALFLSLPPLTAAACSCRPEAPHPQAAAGSPRRVHCSRRCRHTGNEMQAAWCNKPLALCPADWHWSFPLGVQNIRHGIHTHAQHAWQARCPTSAVSASSPHNCPAHPQDAGRPARQWQHPAPRTRPAQPPPAGNKCATSRAPAVSRAARLHAGCDTCWAATPYVSLASTLSTHPAFPTSSALPAPLSLPTKPPHCRTPQPLPSPSPALPAPTAIVEAHLQRDDCVLRVVAAVLSQDLGQPQQRLQEQGRGRAAGQDAQARGGG